MSGHDPLALAEWQRVRRYAVPTWMIAECTEARERGDWRAACRAGRIDVGELGAAAHHAVHLAPDLLRWHLPRALGGDTTLAVDRRYVLIPGEGTLEPDSSVLTVDSPVSVEGSQRLTLGAARWADLVGERVTLLPAYLWDARYAGDLRAAVGGSAVRVPGFSADGEPLSFDALGAGDGPPGRAERSRQARPLTDSFAEAGFVIDGVVGLNRPPPECVQLPLPVPLPVVFPGPGRRAIDPMRLHHDVRLLAARTGLPTWALWLDGDRYLRFDVAGEGVWLTELTTSALELPELPGDMARYFVDLELIRCGRLTPGELHPLVRAALFPAPESSARSVLESAAAPPSPDAPAVLAPGGGAVPGSGGVFGGPGADRDAGPVRVRCRGEWHKVGVRLGRLGLESHTEAEQRRERALRAFGGEVSGCFAVEHAWHGPVGRLPRRLRAHREDLWQRMIHGGTRTVFELLDAGMDVRLRDSRGRTLMHRVRSFDHARLLPRLLADGLDVNARDKEGSTPLYLAIVHRWPGSLIIAMADAGADPHLPNQGDMSVIEHFDDILDYHEDLPADFEAAVAYLRKRA
ncbi:hypothetical protein Ait01nite_076130 [Actinoplanes italicus]|uniref:Uncharacterized protein n=1 Tax=Actinoplanes italicus TaxID=113567 RepID=A0A2T0JZC1_9ACTN|nr:ankyrin repeat domain-containing protein [Actinoplanes italicus]PRX14703.1 hypothetical protein CLV67_12389 [Actinoplanes italicus]GIE34568.1 hypothetical protein Ait01nite_076130 [Actinoplanes italicus]